MKAGANPRPRKGKPEPAVVGAGADHNWLRFNGSTCSKTAAVNRTSAIVAIATAATFFASCQTSPPRRAAAPTTQATQSRHRYFAIQVVDDATGRGVPLVELRTTNNVTFYTDSNGVATLDEPGLMNRSVFFHVASHGYDFPADGFGYHGTALDVAPGGRATIKIKRLNIAERLYRVTGEGIYRDSILAGGFPVPVREPLLNAQVVGQDSVQAAIYHGKIYWMWGDTNRLRYPLGDFWMSGATSDLPGTGGLDPSVGVDLKYFVDDDGFARAMFEPVLGQLKWADAMMVLPDERGVARMLAMCTRLEKLDVVLDRTLNVYDDNTQRFRTLRAIGGDEPLYPRNHPLRVRVDGVDYFYFSDTLPSIRVRAGWTSVRDPKAYEGYTCLPQGSRFTGDVTPLERDERGRLKWAWKRNTDILTQQREEQLLRRGKLKEGELRSRLVDVETKKPVRTHGGSVYFNDFKRKYVLISVEAQGKASQLGEIWYAEADKPEGPWKYARRIVTHDRYSFYNPKHHAFFDQRGGRYIYFEGTYATTFSRPDREATPRYDYNQIMYRLDLSDPRLELPPADGEGPS